MGSARALSLFSAAHASVSYAYATERVKDGRDALSIHPPAGRHPTANAVVVTLGEDRVAVVLCVSNRLRREVGHERREEELLALAVVAALVVCRLADLIAVAG